MVLVVAVLWMDGIEEEFGREEGREVVGDEGGKKKGKRGTLFTCESCSKVCPYHAYRPS